MCKLRQWTGRRRRTLLLASRTLCEQAGCLSSCQKTGVRELWSLALCFSNFFLFISLVASLSFSLSCQPRRLLSDSLPHFYRLPNCGSATPSLSLSLFLLKNRQGYHPRTTASSAAARRFDTCKQQFEALLGREENRKNKSHNFFCS